MWLSLGLCSGSVVIWVFISPSSRIKFSSHLKMVAASAVFSMRRPLKKRFVTFPSLSVCVAMDVLPSLSNAIFWVRVVMVKVESVSCSIIAVDKENDSDSTSCFLGCSCSEMVAGDIVSLATNVSKIKLLIVVVAIMCCIVFFQKCVI